MNQKLISRLVMGALVGLAATGSYAGQIQSSSVSIAREVITTDTQAVTSPTVAYRFSGDVDARLQNQTFQIQFALPAGATWNTAGVAASIVVADGQTGTSVAQGLTHGLYTVDTLAIDAGSPNVLYATITVHSDGSGLAAGLIKQPIISISSSTVPANNPTIKGLFTVVKAIEECDVQVKTLPISFKHYVALSAPASLASDTTATPDEHNRSGSTNATTLITFPTNILVKVTKSSGNAKLNVASGNTLFAGTTGTSFISTTLANLGNVSLVQNASGYDSNLLDPYILADASAPAGLKGIATAIHGTGSAVTVAGDVEVERVTVKVSASQGLSVGGSLFLATDALCAAPVAGSAVAITAGNAAGPITLTVPTAGVNAAFGVTGAGPVHVCYGVSGTALIPGSNFAVDAATVVKAAAGTDLNEQNNFCKGPLYALSGSIKIDVRNYANSTRTDGWMSIVRLINTSETRTATVFGQYIHADGMYGKWGKVATLAPRAVLNMTPAEVDTLLTNAPAHATAALNATTAVGTAGSAPRLRLTTEDGDTLRVQNYLYNPDSKNFIEASSSQGVDFTGSTDRAPANEGQYQEQDAQKGLNGGN
ncbi:hypothetical protein FNU76_13250 [Chitinimonas arctica]|uniref:Uncharacterized protein n=1 Tax=Chitinimonas arctica TaxID=2594795 RepID=A0A516SGL9_9NEIS|nr:hypothetical protein [Chitinimonas arctica]QDQ27250.1 hypothetical protein FNU76_13250 [Chitinimonas arctica]